MLVSRFDIQELEKIADKLRDLKSLIYGGASQLSPEIVTDLEQYEGYLDNVLEAVEILIDDSTEIDE